VIALSLIGMSVIGMSAIAIALIALTAPSAAPAAGVSSKASGSVTQLQQRQKLIPGFLVCAEAAEHR
jgi:hypothetical protein